MLILSKFSDSLSCPFQLENGVMMSLKRSLLSLMFTCKWELVKIKLRGLSIPYAKIMQKIFVEKRDLQKRLSNLDQRISSASSVAIPRLNYLIL